MQTVFEKAENQWKYNKLEQPKLLNIFKTIKKCLNV